MVQIKEHGQSNIVDKVGVIVDVGAQICSLGDSQIKPQLALKLNMVNSHTLPIVSISQVTSTNNLITLSWQKGVTSEIRWTNWKEEPDDHITSHGKLSLEAPIFVPKGRGITSGSSSLHIGRQLVSTGTNVQEVSGCDKELLDTFVT